MKTSAQRGIGNASECDAVRHSGLGHRNAKEREHRSRVRSHAVGSVIFSAGWLVRLSVGFFTWLAAGRLFPASEVGAAASAISAMLLCVEVGILGVDSALIALYPAHSDDPRPLLRGALTLGIGAASVCGLGCVALGSFGLASLRVIGVQSPGSLVFLFLVSLQAGWWLMDQLAVALRRTDHVPIRACLAAATTLVGVVLAGFAGLTSAPWILTAWALAALVAAAVGRAQIASVVGRGWLRLGLTADVVRRLLTVGLGNFTLTAADIAPGLLLPMVAAQTLTQRHAAYWYTVWMMAFAAYTVPMSFGLHLFAGLAKDPKLAGAQRAKALRTGIILALAAALALISFGPMVLGMIGRTYETYGAAPLRLAALAAIPMVFFKAYLYTCRGLARTKEGTAVATIAGVSSVGLAAVLARVNGLEGIAEGWLLVQTIGGLFGLIRMWRLTAVNERRHSAEAPRAVLRGAA